MVQNKLRADRNDNFEWKIQHNIFTCTRHYTIHPILYVRLSLRFNAMVTNIKIYNYYCSC